jgi:hypothetical protein
MADFLLVLCKPFVFLGPSDFRGSFWGACLRNTVRLVVLFVSAFLLTCLLVSMSAFQPPSRDEVASRFSAVQAQLAAPEFVANFKSAYQIDPAALIFDVRSTVPGDDKSYEIVLTGKIDGLQVHETLGVVRKPGLDSSIARRLNEVNLWPFREIIFSATPFVASTVLLSTSASGDLSAQERLLAKAKLDQILANAPSAKSPEFAVPRRLNGPIQFGCYFLFFLGSLLLVLHWLANVVPNIILRSAESIKVRREPEYAVAAPPAPPVVEGQADVLADQETEDEGRAVVIGNPTEAGIQDATIAHRSAEPDRVADNSQSQPNNETPKKEKERPKRVDVITPWSGRAIGDLDTFIAVLEEIRTSVRDRAGVFGARPVFPLLDIRITGLKAMKTARSGENVPSFVAVEADAAAERLEAKHRFSAFTIWAIPTLGFIGTVVGIGDALLSTVDLQSAFELARSKAESAVGLSIGVAFDTTYVALFLSFFLMLLLHFVQDAEDNMLAREKRSALQDLLQVENLRPANDMQDFAQLLAGWGLSLAQISRWFESLKVDRRKMELALAAFSKANVTGHSTPVKTSGPALRLIIVALLAVLIMQNWEAVLGLFHNFAGSSRG